MEKTSKVISNKVTISTTPVEINFERQIQSIMVKVVSNNAYIGFDTTANTDDALIETTDGWVYLDDIGCTRLSVKGAGSGTLYYIATR
jgi:hypothetical protein